MTTTTRQIEISNTDDVIDVRDITERVEQLEEQPTKNDDGACYSCGSYVKESDENHEPDCEVLELQRLNALLDELRGNGGDHDWRDAWYPITLIRESHFEDYAENLADELGYMDKNTTWPYNHINWEAAANELLIDYSSVEFDGVTYYYR